MMRFLAAIGATGVALKDESGTGGFTLERGP